MLFALTYSVAVIGSYSVVYSGTLVAVAWPSVGIAVWWAVTCRSWRTYAYICAIIFLVPALYLLFLTETSLRGVLLVGIAHVISGPAIAPILMLAEKFDPTEPVHDEQLFVPFSRIRVARHVYRLLIAGIFTVAISKLLVILAYVLGDVSASFTLYLTMVLRDLAGIIAIAGPGLAISSSLGRSIGRAAWREFGVVLLVTAVVLAAVFGYAQQLPIVYLAMLPLYWSATRLPVALAVFHAVLTSVATTLLYYLVGRGPFAISDESVFAQATALQLFVIMCILLSLVVSTTVQQSSATVEELEVLAKTLPDALLIVNRDGKAFPVNEAAYDLVDRLPNNQYITRKIEDIHGEPVNDQNCPSERALRGEMVNGLRVRIAEGYGENQDVARRIFKLSASPLYLRGESEPGHALLLYHDSTSEHSTMEQLKNSYEESHILFENAPHGVAILDSTGEIMQANGSFADLVEMPANQLIGHTLEDFSVENGIIEQAKPALKTPGEVLHFDRGFETARGQSKSVALSFRALHADNDPTGPLLVNAVDVTERHELLELVEHLADHDSLTGLLNRRRLELDFERAFLESQREAKDGALLSLDLDNFKAVNDALGHTVGDELLVEIGQILTECVRDTDIVGRMGGDEFVVVLPESDNSGAEAISKRIVETVNQRFKDRGNELSRVTVSIGFIMFSEAREQGSSPFILADQQLYDAKNAGRNRIAKFNTQSTVKRTKKQQITVEHLQEILQSDSIRLELQPIIELSTGRVNFAEALLRVDEGTVDVTTGEFVKAVEQAKLGPKLDIQVLSKGLGVIENLRRKSPNFRLSLNMSAQSLGSQELRIAFESALREHGVPPGALILEITETAPLEDFTAARDFQSMLDKFGVALALDDFGVGHDPYRYLKLLDFRYLKIAGEFVEKMPDSDVDRNIVESIIRLANDQGISTVAEFVSDEQVLDSVRRRNITYAQGFYIGGSLSPDDFMTKYFGTDNNEEALA